MPCCRSVETRESKPIEVVPAKPGQAPSSTDFGPLALLAGKWVNAPSKLGLNVISMPAPGTKPDSDGSFVFVHQDMNESLTFEPIADAVRNRGGCVEQLIGAVKYTQAVADGNGDGIHEENGMFLWLKPTTTDPGHTSPYTSPYTIARSGSVPHGNTFLLHGTTRESTGSDASLEEVRTVSDSMAKLNYSETFGNREELRFPTRRLDEHNKGLTIKRTTVFELDSRNEGQVANVPFIKAMTDVPFMRSILYHHVVEDPKRPGETFEQLQYVQQMDLMFHHHPGNEELISWPHITVNTLVRP